MEDHAGRLDPAEDPAEAADDAPRTQRLVDLLGGHDAVLQRQDGGLVADGAAQLGGDALDLPGLDPQEDQVRIPDGGDGLDGFAGSIRKSPRTLLTVNPRSRIARPWAPRATKTTSFPAAARRPPKYRRRRPRQ